MQREGGHSMTVRHMTGTLDVVDGNVVAQMTGTRGFFKKEAWTKTELLPIKRLASVRKTADDKGKVTLSFQKRYGDLPVAFLDCRTPEDIETFLETLSDDVVVEADGIVWQAFRADIRAGSPDLSSPSESGSVAPKQCGNCGAPFALTTDGRCIHCHAVLKTS
jgi:hypothetical protein